MVLEEKYGEIINKMTKTVLVDVKAYLTDFTSFDISQFCELVKNVNMIQDAPSEALWCIRDTGTHLLYPGVGKNIDHFPDIVNMNERYFYINLEGKTEFKKVRYSEAQEIVKNWKEDFTC